MKPANDTWSPLNHIDRYCADLLARQHQRNIEILNGRDRGSCNAACANNAPRTNND